MKQKTALNSKYRRKLTQVCKVLFPEYTKVRVTRKGDVILKGRTNKEIVRKQRYSHDYLIDFLLISRFTIFKYNNKDFLGEVFAQVTSAHLNNVNTVDFIFTGLVNLKLPQEKDNPFLSSCHVSFFEAKEDNHDFYVFNSEQQIRSLKRLWCKTIDHPLYYYAIGTVIILSYVAFFLWINNISA